ncbi:MAG TPA: hypothetical protein VLF89_05980 [Candidatus Saccharimonadales bacterium]|nr:hypothetical protein [Candidatus Saccharimonadales bacterium]
MSNIESSNHRSYEEDGEQEFHINLTNTNPVIQAMGETIEKTPFNLENAMSYIHRPILLESIQLWGFEKGKAQIFKAHVASIVEQMGKTYKKDNWYINETSIQEGDTTIHYTFSRNSSGQIEAENKDTHKIIQYDSITLISHPRYPSVPVIWDASAIHRKSEELKSRKHYNQMFRPRFINMKFDPIAERLHFLQGAFVYVLLKGELYNTKTVAKLRKAGGTIIEVPTNYEDFSNQVEAGRAIYGY